MKLTELQQNKLNQMTEYYFSLKEKKILYYKAPTGSGKTFVTTSFISEIFKNTTEKIIVFFATVSSQDLHKQINFQINKYNNYLSEKVKTLLVESPSNTKKVKIDQEYNISLNNKTCYILGKSSFGKNKILTEKNILKNLLIEAKERKYKILYFRDEAHIGDEKINNKNVDFENFEHMMNQYSDFIYKMTATPPLDSKYDSIIEVTEKELFSQEQKLLKFTSEKNKGLKNVLEMSDSELLEFSLNKFKDIKKDYSLLEERINPAMIIQINNFTEKDKKYYLDELFNLKKIINKSGLKWASLVSDDDYKTNHVNDSIISSENLVKNDNEIDILIIKVGPSVGWDIPRACFLLQLRRVASETLSTQTLGRIRRNPLKNLSSNVITDKYYWYSNVQLSDKELIRYSLKDNYKNSELLNFVRGVIKSETYKSTNQINKKDIYIEEFNKPEITNNVKDLIEKNTNEASIKFSKMVLINKDEKSNTIITGNLNNFIDVFIYSKRIMDKYSFIDKDFIDLLSLEAKKLKISFYYLILILSNTHFFENISEKIYNKMQMQFENSDVEFIEAKLSDSFLVWKRDSGTDKQIDQKAIWNLVPYYNSQLSKNLDKNLKGEEVMYLDSNPEVSFYASLIDLFLKNKKRLSKYKLVTKSEALGSDIYFEYSNKTDSLITPAKSFPDFLIKTTKHSVYIEIKSKEDYDPKKTEKLKIAYKKYASNNEFIVMAIATIDFTVNKLNPIILIDVWHKNNFLENVTLSQLLDFLENL